MTNRAFFLAPIFLLGGCGYSNPPSAYEHTRDRFFSVLPLPMIDDDFVPCFRTINGEPGRLSDEDCYRFSEPRRMRGVAVTGFEGGNFFAGRTTAPNEDESSDIWIEINPAILPADVRDNCRQDCSLYLDFIGRRTAVEGHYGHMEINKHQIAVDRVLHATLLD